MFRRIPSVLLLFLLWALQNPLCLAQSTTSLRGVVTDAKGAVMPGTTVSIRDAETGFARTVTSGTDGVYQFLQIPPATYSLEVTARGFAPLKRENVTLLVSTPATLNITLQVQGTTEKVEVTSEAPVVNTQDASIGNAFTERQLLKLPSEGRDPASILSLQPGVTYIGSSKQIDQTNDSRGGAVAGARSDQTNITLDGLDDNDQLMGIAFQGALRSTLDSLEEFRVTTSNGNSDEGRSSGAQVTLVTKSGTNRIHGTAYEYNRSSIGEANDWFNKAAEIRAGLPNKAPQLIRNTFGATFGGPIKKDRLFYFLAFEGQRKRETIQTTQIVPSNQLRNGVMQYVCSPNDPANGPDPNCTPNNPKFTVLNEPSIAGPGNFVVQLTPAQFAALDPIAALNGVCPWANSQGQCGVDPNVLPVFQKYPQPNTDTQGDLLDYRAYTFPGADPVKLNTYIARLDYKITANGNHSLFLRGNLQNDSEATPPQFPGQPAFSYNTTNSKAIAAGYTALLRPTLINNFRWSLIRQGNGTSGLNSRPYVYFRTLTAVTGLNSQSEYVNVPVHNFVDDVTWTKGKHSLQFGANLRLVHNNRVGNMQNVTADLTDPFQLDNASIANTSLFGSSFCNGPVQLNGNQQCSLDPAGFVSQGYPRVSSTFRENYDFATVGLAGIVSTVNPTFNQDKNGNLIPPGALITRRFKAWEAEWYAQDSWRATPNLTVTAGLRYSLLQPPYEVNGVQAAPTISIGNLFAQRAKAQLAGQAYSPGQGAPGSPAPIQFALSGQGNGKQPYWDWDYKDLAPRFAIAYSPHADEGWLRRVFGGPGKSSIRAGYGLYFDHFGEGMVNTFDRHGSFGLTTLETNPAGVQDVDCAARFTSTFSLPQGTFCGQGLNGVAPAPFPNTPFLGPNVDGGFAITWGIDDKLKTPYSHAFNFSITRDLGHNYSIEAAYIGRLGRHLLQETDLGLPEDIVDPKSHMDYFTAATQLTKEVNAGGAINPIPFWENLFPTLVGANGVSATQNIANQIWIPGDEIVSLQALDTPMLGTTNQCNPACSQLPGQKAPTPYNFFMPQFSSLWGWRTSGNSSYHALNLTLRRVASRGIQFDVNYTYSRSIDVGSNAERINVLDTNGSNVGGFASQVINSWAPNQLRAVSDFDMTHQLNSNWVIDLPVGRGKRLGGGMGSLGNALVGGWSLSGLFHWSSGLPFSIFPGGGWSTNYNLTGQAIETANPGPVGVHTDAQGNPTMWANPSAVATNDFRHPYPGEGGQRNELRGPGYFGIDAGLSKEWPIREDQTLSFSWEAFNVTNAVRFDAALASNQFDLTTVTNFGVYSSTLTQPRVMQFMLRYSF
jgi:hypothetical protein